MKKIENTEFKVEIQLRAIEIINSSLQSPVNPKVSVSNFNFNIGIETKADASSKLAYVIVSINIRNDDETIILGSLTVSCIFEIVNFDSIIKNDIEGNLEIPQQLIEILNSISISTARGVMYSTFKGTFLHNAVLPIIDPKQIQPSQLEP